MASRETFDLGLGGGVNAAFGFCWTVAQGDGHATARLEEGNQLAESAGAIGWEHMHPDRAQQDYVEGQTKTEDMIETWERIRDPSDRWRRM